MTVRSAEGIIEDLEDAIATLNGNSDMRFSSSSDKATAAALRLVYDLARSHELLRCRSDDTQKLAEWLLTLDDPEDVIGREERRCVTLTQIIDRARAALSVAQPDGNDA